MIFVPYICLVVFSTNVFIEAFGRNGHPLFELWKNNTLPKKALDILEIRKKIKEAGAVAEVYKVTSEDGYIMQLTRVKRADGVSLSTREGRGTPVLLVHGNIASYDIWIIRGNDTDLPFLLLDEGFDVWLCDKRGNYYSKNHVTLSANDMKFWNYTNHETGYYDLPAFIDTIIEVTGKPKVVVIGHSLGSTDLYTMCSARPEYNEKLLIGISFAPVGYRMINADFDSPARISLNFNLVKDIFTQGANFVGIGEVLPRSRSLIKSLLNVCLFTPGKDYCMDLIGLVFGENRKNMEERYLRDMLSRIPAGAGLKTYLHVAQYINWGFNYYDDGRIGNMKRYGTPKPPAYPIHRITAPSAFFYGHNDKCNSGRGIREFARSVPGTVLVREIPDPKFNHIDFVFGTNAPEVLYKEVIALIKKYVNKN